MTTNDEQFELPGKIDQYLATLNRLYEKEEEIRLRDIVVNGVVTIHKEWDYDNWNGGTYGHAITLTLSEDHYLEVMSTKNKNESRICTDINNLNNTQNEHISEVFIEMELIESDQWREGSGVLRPRIVTSSIPDKALSRIWGDGQIRVFLSHKARFKKETLKLKHALERCGLTSFVAHEDIEPTQEWLREIERALLSMDAFVALLTDDYHDSDWTDQEVGVAIGRGTPLIAVRLGRDPYGLMGKRQGLGACEWSNPDDMAAKIFALLYKSFPDRSRVFEAALSAYAVSRSWGDSAWKVRHLFENFETLEQNQVDKIMEAYKGNAKNESSFDGMDRLKPLLEKWTKENWDIVDNLLVPGESRTLKEQNIPF